MSETDQAARARQKKKLIRFFTLCIRHSDSHTFIEIVIHLTDNIGPPILTT